MPTYEYKCEGGCQNFELKQGIKEDALTECPRCGSSVQRVIGRTSYVAKCGGFYGKESK